MDTTTKPPSPGTPTPGLGAGAAPALTCDDEHRYWLGAERLWGVNEVIQDNGLEEARWFKPEDSSRGQVIHIVLAGLARGLTFDWAELDCDLHGWVKSGDAFLREIVADGAVILAVEKMAHSPLYRFAGTIDLLVLWRGYEWILDWKSGKASKVTRFKLAAYDALLGPTANGKPRRRAAVELDRDGGRAKMVEYNTPAHFHDANRFLSYLNTSRDRREFGPKEH